MRNVTQNSNSGNPKQYSILLLPESEAFVQSSFIYSLVVDSYRPNPC